MASKRTHSEEGEEKSRRRKLSRREQGKAMESPGGEMAPPSSRAGDPAALLADPQAAHPANAPLRAEAVAELQQRRGNRYAQRRLQAKLTVGQPDDRYEKEADRVAEQVTARPEPQAQRRPLEEEGEELRAKPVADQITPLLQRQAEPEEEEEEPIQAKPLATRITPLVQRQGEEEEEPIQPKQVGEETSRVEGDLEGRINAVRGGGQPLPESQRSFFEPRFGHDFSQVRVHTDAEAAEIAEALQARAFTVGHDIVFAAGQHAPETTAGETLLAHELTHVVQQKGANRVSREAAKNDEEEVSPPPGPYTGRRMRNDKMDWYEHNANLFGPPIFERYTRSKALWAPLQGLVEAYWKAGGIQSGIKLDTPQLQQAAWKLLKEVTTPREMGIIKRNVEDYGDSALVEAVFVEFRKHYRPAKRLAHRDWLRSNFRHFHEWAAVTFNFVSPPYAYHAKRAAGT